MLLKYPEEEETERRCWHCPESCVGRAAQGRMRQPEDAAWLHVVLPSGDGGARTGSTVLGPGGAWEQGRGQGLPEWGLSSLAPESAVHFWECYVLLPTLLRLPEVGRITDLPICWSDPCPPNLSSQLRHRTLKNIHFWQLISSKESFQCLNSFHHREKSQTFLKCSPCVEFFLCIKKTTGMGGFLFSHTVLCVALCCVPPQFLCRSFDP